MKKQRIIIVIVAGLLILGAILAYVFRDQLGPSQQMKELKQLETSLNLPKPQERRIDDRGYNTDAKGAKHYSREIVLSYADVKVLDTLRSKLLQNSWREEQVGPIETLSYQYFRFVRGSGDDTQCVSGFVDPTTDDGTPLYIALEASGNYGCNNAPGT